MLLIRKESLAESTRPFGEVIAAKRDGVPLCNRLGENTASQDFNRESVPLQMVLG
jgi:hypothetical protein